MIELRSDSLVFNFQGVHPSAVLTLNFQRTLRIPDDGRNHHLPPGFGRFPLRHVDDFASRVPRPWIEHGGVMLPMHQAEAMWICFDGQHDDARGVEYPFAVKIATGKINAVSGERWKGGVNRNPQDYVVVPEQPWLDGYSVEKGIIRQFVAMRLGDGYTAEEQITGKAEHGGLQIVAYPMKREVFERRFPKTPHWDLGSRPSMPDIRCCASTTTMGLAPGGRMKQEVYEDPYELADWDLEHSSRCFVHIANSEVWRQVTGENPPTTSPSARQYTDAGLPWFDWYDDQNHALAGAKVLRKLKGVVELAGQKRYPTPPENRSVRGEKVIALRAGLRKGQVREMED